MILWKFRRFFANDHNDPTHLVLDDCRRAVLWRRSLRYILLQGDLVGGKAERRRLHLEHQLIDSEASVSSHAVSGSRDGNHLRREGGVWGVGGLFHLTALNYNLYFVLITILVMRPKYPTWVTRDCATDLTLHCVAMSV